MSDDTLVERLRSFTTMFYDSQLRDLPMREPICLQAADRITALETKLAAEQDELVKRTEERDRLQDDYRIVQHTVARLTTERDAALKLVELRTADLGSVAAERDRLREALLICADEGFWKPRKATILTSAAEELIRRAKIAHAALSPEGEGR